MIYFLRNFNTRFQLLLLLIALFVGFSLSGWAQCVSSVAQTDILCDGSNITISATVGSQVRGFQARWYGATVKRDRHLPSTQIAIILTVLSLPLVSSRALLYHLKVLF